MNRVGVVGFPGSNPSGIVAAFRRVGVRAEVLLEASEGRHCERLVLPGVGSFGPAADFLRTSGFGSLLLEKIDLEVPVLGICLGFHLFCSKSEEGPEHQGLGFINARVERLKSSVGRRVPHIGWSQLRAPAGNEISGLRDQSLVYFAHSYEVVLPQPEVSAWMASYGGSDLVAAFCQGSFIGVQFHPEKSNESGLKLLKNFAS